MRGGDRARQEDEAAVRDKSKGGDCGLNMGCSVYWRCRELDAHPGRDCADRARVGIPARMIRVLQNSHSDNAGNDLLEHLQPFSGESVLEDREAADVAA